MYESISVANPPVVGMAVASSGVDAKHIGIHLLQSYAEEVGFKTTHHLNNKDKNKRARRVEIACTQGGKPRETGKHPNPEVIIRIPPARLSVCLSVCLSA